jgi:PiT family inorganic phosphate transporter
MMVILIAMSGFIYVRSRLQPISADNVNDDWDGTPSAARRRTEVSA